MKPDVFIWYKMIGYLLHQSPLWTDLPNGKRNVRIVFMALSMYICLHALANGYHGSNFVMRTIRDYFYWILAADIFICACTYKIYYGRTILQELNPYETDKYDESTHTYMPTKPDAKIKVDAEINIDGDLEPDLTPGVDPTSETGTNSEPKVDAKLEPDIKPVESPVEINTKLES